MFNLGTIRPEKIFWTFSPFLFTSNYRSPIKPAVITNSNDAVKVYYSDLITTAKTSVLHMHTHTHTLSVLFLYKSYQTLNRYKAIMKHITGQI